MMERFGKVMLAKAMIVVAIIGVAVSALAESAAIIKDNCTHLVADVRMSADSVTAGRVDGVADRVSRIEANQTIYQSKQDGRLLQLESSLSRIDEVVDSRVDGRCEKKIGDLKKLADGFYEARYRELKAAHDRFMGRVDVFLVILGVFVAIVGVVATIISILIPWLQEHSRKKEWQGLKDGIEKLRSDAFHAMEKDRQMKAEFYFQLAKMGFEQYKSTKSEDVLEIVIKDLSQCIMHNVGTMNGRGAKSAILFLNTVLVRPHSDGDGLPTEIVEHRKEACKNLAHWEWGFGLDELNMVLDASDVDEHSAGLAKPVMKKVFEMCGREDD